jgi:hypothetical protein
VQVTELVEPHAFGLSAPNAMQQVESKTFTITDGELVRTI